MNGLRVIPIDAKSNPNFLTALLEQEDGVLEKKIHGKDVSPEVRFQVVRTLSSYLSKLEVKCAVIECDYVDRDYLDDYGRYYSRCYEKYERRCCRIHFFSKQYDSKELGTILSKSDAEVDLKTFSEAYLGFVVIRPLPTAIVGRTCLRTYPDRDVTQPDAGCRYYRALTDVRVSFFGRELMVRCMPFLQQDSTTAACASCALWSAFAVTARLFQHKQYCPGCITSLATEHGMYEGLSFPNGGLWKRDMVYAIRGVGLEPLCFGGIADGDDAGQSPTPHELLGYIYAYLEAGLPIILTGMLIDSLGFRGAHAVTVNGYHLREDTSAEGDLKSDRIDKLYVHDDQIGPGARIVLDRPSNKWITDWSDRGVPLGSNAEGAWSEMRNLAIMVPVYQKMRVDYGRVAQHVDQLIQILGNIVHPERLGDLAARNVIANGLRVLCDQFKIDLDGLIKVTDTQEWDIRLQTCEAFKSEIRTDQDLVEPQSKMSYILQGYPRYLWNVGLSCLGQKHLRFIIDATDSGLGLRVISVIKYSDRLDLIWKLAALAWKSVTCRNPFLNALVWGFQNKPTSS